MGKDLKLYYSIREVSEMVGVAESALRFWEKEIPTLSPKKTPTGVRQYTQDDIALVRLIHHLVKEQGLTVKAARARLKTSKHEVVTREEIVTRLKTVRAELMEIKSKLDELYLLPEESREGVRVKANKRVCHVTHPLVVYL